MPIDKPYSQPDASIVRGASDVDEDGYDRWAAVQRMAGELDDIKSDLVIGRSTITDVRLSVTGKLTSIQILTGDAQHHLGDTLTSWATEGRSTSIQQGDGLEAEWLLLLEDLKERSEHP